MTPTNLRSKTLSGIVWNIVSQFGQQGLMFVIMVVLARLLSPHEFGLVAMVTVITSFANLFAEMGFSAALIQKQDIQPIHLSSVFWLNVIAGGALTLLFILGAPLLAAFYNEPALIPLTIASAVNFSIASLGIVQMTLKTKAMDFQTLSLVEITATGVAGGVAIGLAYGGFGVWSLVGQSLVLSGVTVILLWLLSDWRPRFQLHWGYIKELLGFSVSLFGTNILNYWARNIDYLLIGRFLGTDPLGIYYRAYDIMLVPLTSVSRVLSRVMFPSLALVQSDPQRVRNMFLRLTRTVALASFPMMFGLLVTVEPFVLTLFGDQWREMIPLLRVFALIGLLQSIITLNGNLYLSQGRADLQFKVSLAVKAVAITGIIIGLRWGIVGVAVGYAVASVLCAYPSFFFAGKLVGLTFRQLLENLASVFVCAAGMAGLVWGLASFIPANWPVWLSLIVQVAVGGGLYLGLIHGLRVKAYQEARALLIEQWQRLRGMRGATPVESPQ